LLLPWINGEPAALPSERLAAFLASGAVRQSARELVGVRAGRFDADALRADLAQLVDGHFSAHLSLHVDAERHGDRYWARVAGDIRDVVIYEVWRILTDPGIVTLARCPAPRAGNWRQRCGHWFITRGERRGRSREYCSDKCRQRLWKKIDAEKAKNARKKPAAAYKKGTKR
jgi:hypothetical protein